MLPPEYRNEAFKTGDGQVNAEFDIFQLGLFLWHLYRDQDQQNAQTFCLLAGCSNAEAGSCGQPHADPIALPKAAEDVPDWLDCIIASCRDAAPRKTKASKCFPVTRK